MPSKLLLVSELQVLDVSPETLRSICRRRATEPRDIVPVLLLVLVLCWELWLDLERRQSLLLCRDSGVVHPFKLLSDRLSLEEDKVWLRCGSLRTGGVGVVSVDFGLSAIAPCPATSLRHRGGAILREGRGGGVSSEDRLTVRFGLTTGLGPPSS